MEKFMLALLILFRDVTDGGKSQCASAAAATAGDNRH